MRISVTVTPRARAARVERSGEHAFRVSVTAPPHAGRANAAVVEALAAHFGIPRSRVRIVRGGAGRHKVVEIVEG